ncbi:hypothetical protein R1sor_024996 [Riccia sorocarpa]|uniref:Uncharacterized protein n=1 Tax=Riccia sorocarpa TaxID=122646 RepID=A0ABD3G7C8_9MARC
METPVVMGWEEYLLAVSVDRIAWEKRWETGEGPPEQPEILIEAGNSSQQINISYIITGRENSNYFYGRKMGFTRFHYHTVDFIQSHNSTSFPIRKPHIAKLVKNLMDADGKDLGPQLPAYVQGPNPHVVQNTLPRGPGALGEFGSNVWSTRPELESKFADLLTSQRSWGIIQILLIGFLQKYSPAILRENGGPFHVSRGWIRRWVSSRLGWLFRASSIAASKLPDNYEVHGYQMVLRLSYLVVIHKIPEDLLVNMDQTGLHLVHVSGERTYARKGAREISVSGKDDRRQITVAVSSTAAGELLPLRGKFWF